MTDRMQSWFKASESADPCPAADELWSFARGEMTADRRDALRDHLTGCVWCCEKIARVSVPGTDGSVDQPVPADLDRKTRRIWHSNLFQGVWRSPVLWMVLFVASLTASFTLPRYYKQFLVMALVAGIRWALSERAGRHSLTITKLSSSGAKDRSSPERDPTRHSH